MTPTLWLRIAAVIQLLFTIGHTLGGRKSWSPMRDNEVLRQMTTVHFDAMGENRSYLDFFMGFGWSLSVVMLLEAALLWQLATLARTDPAGVRPLILTFVLATIATGIIAWRFIFPLPALFSLAVIAALVIAYVASSRGGALPHIA